jgi:hypothetical protein
MPQDIESGKQVTQGFAAPVVTDAGEFSEVTLGTASNNDADDTEYKE